MAKAFRKLEVEFNGARYVLGRTGAEMFLAWMDQFTLPEHQSFNTLREDLRVSLAIETDDPTPPNPFDSEELRGVEVKTFVLYAAAAPHCFFCGSVGVLAGLAEDDMWRCQNTDCFRSEAGNFTRPVFEGGVQ